jgi:hypothetical protein
MPLCRVCGEREARFRTPHGRWRADRAHDMCPQCYRGARDRSRALTVDSSSESTPAEELYQPLITGSSLQRAQACAGAAVLPAVARETSWSASGSAGHEHLALRLLLGVDEAMAQLPQICRRWQLDEREEAILTAKLRAFEFIPPRGARAEVPLALFEDGHVERVDGSHGEYAVPAGAIFAMTVDLLWTEPEPLVIQRGWHCPPGSKLWVVDYKLGEETYVHAVEDNAQALAGALLAARFTGALAVVPALCFVRPGRGLWDQPEAYLDEPALADVEARLHHTHQRILAARAAYLAGEQRFLTYLTEGAHCDFCPAALSCPAKTLQLKMVLAGDDDLLVRPDEVAITPVQAQRLALALPQLNQFMRQARKALEAYVAAAGPIPLGDGNKWGPYDHTSQVVDPRQGVRRLAEEIGERAARGALKVELGKGAMEAAIKQVHAARGLDGQVSRTFRRVLARLHEDGAITEEHETWWGPHKPNK